MNNSFLDLKKKDPYRRKRQIMILNSGTCSQNYNYSQDLTTPDRSGTTPIDTVQFKANPRFSETKARLTGPLFDIKKLELEANKPIISDPKIGFIIKSKKIMYPAKLVID